MLCFRKFPVAKKFDRGKGGLGRVKIFSGKFLSHSAEKFRRLEIFSVSFFSGSEKFC